MQCHKPTQSHCQLILIRSGIRNNEKEKKRVEETRKRVQSETVRNLSWYSNRVWLNFNNFSTFCSLTFFCLLGPRHALITTYNVWVASNGCTTQQDSSHLSTCHSPLALGSRVWLPLATLTVASTGLTGAWFVWPKKRKLCANLL